MSRRRALALALLLVACPGDKGGTTAQTTGTTADASSGTTTTASGTTAAPTSTAASSSGSTSAASSGTTAGLDCNPTDLPACPVQGCRQDWSYECPGCGEFLGDLCFEIDVGCTYPALNCNLPSPCAGVWGMGYDTIDALDDENAAICFLTALRDGTPGAFGLLYGEMGDEPYVYLNVYSGGTGVVLVEYATECQGCPDSGYFGRTGQLELQPDTYFDDCLAAPTTASLTQCVFGFTTFVHGAPPPADYAPPWTTGKCAALDIACP